MKLIVPFVKLNPWVEREMRDLRAIFYHTQGDNDYVDLVSDLWTRGDTFIINEQDKLPWPGAIQELWECPMIWCAYSYPRYLQSSGPRELVLLVNDKSITSGP